MSDTVTFVVIDDFGPEQGQITNNQMTDDLTPTVRVTLTTSSGATLQAGDVIKVGEAGSSLGQVTLTADDVSRGYVDMAVHYLMPTNQVLDAGAYDASGALLAGGNLSVTRAPDSSGVVHTTLSDGGYTLSFTDNSSTPFYAAYVQRYDSAGHTVGQEFQGHFESGSPNNYSITPLANGGYVALFLDGDHFTNRKGPVVDAQGHVLNSVATGFNGVATAGSLGGFILVSEDVGGTGDTNIQAFANDGTAMSNILSVSSTSTHPFYVQDADGKIEVHWNDHGTDRTLLMDPLHTDSRADPPVAPSFTVLDNAGAQTGTVAAGSSTDDTTPTVRIPVNHAGEIYFSFGPSTSSSQSQTLQISSTDLSRGYVELDVSKTAGEGYYTLSGRYADSDGLVGPKGGFSFLIRSDDHQGTAGPDTESAQSDGAYMTGQGGADVFVFNPATTRFSVVTDFTPGTDKLDFTVMLSANQYRGSDPFADGTITYSTPAFGGDTQVFFDPDGSAGPKTAFYTADLYNVTASQLSHSDFITGTSASPPPPPTSPPPPAGGQTLQGQPGGSNLQGGSGDDTLVGGSGPDTMTGAGGGDHFAWNVLPWSPGHVTDFTDGADKLDLSGLLSAYHYSGSDPVADGWVKPIDDGHGNTWLYFDTDGRGSGDQWGTFVTTLDHVSASQITSADLAGGATTSPPPPTSPPPTSPPPPGVGGETLHGQNGGSNMVGGSGEDTLIGGTGPDTMTGAGGADHFRWNALPWSPGHVTDFTDGTDRLDFSSLLSAYHYSGSDPVADGWVKAIDDGHGNAWLYFDTDGRGSGDQWGTFVATLDHVSASQITGADLTTGADTPPPPPPQQSPPPSSGGQVIRASDGGSTLVGTSGDDTLIGAHGPDAMTGAGGADHFEFDVLPWSAGRITDFTHGVDHIDLSRLLSAAGYSGSDPIADGYVKLIDDGHGNSWLYFDTDGHGSADAWGTFVATLQGVSSASLTGSDFIFH